jgi:ABC-type uncharacterized transport system involved in gliding motility auxiliary subunit
MNRIAEYIGPVGLGSLTAGVLVWLFAPHRERVWAAFLIAGLVLTVSYAVTHWKEMRNLAGRRQARYGANLLILTVLVALILVVINRFGYLYNKRWDLTASKQYSLSDQSVKILGNLDRDLEFIIFDRSDRAAAARELLDQYRYHSGRVSVEVVDQEMQPARAAKYITPAEGSIALGTIVIDDGNKVLRVSNPSEQEITNALIKILKEKKKLYLLEGHAEKDEDISVIKTKLEESNYEVAKLHLLESMHEGRIQIPDDAAVILVVGPRRDFLPVELDTLREYVLGGGKAVFLLDPELQAPTPNLVGFIGELGVDVGNNVIFDASGIGSVLLGTGPEMPLALYYGMHPITDGFEGIPSVYPIVRSVQSTEETPDRISVTNLFSTSDESWSEEDMEAMASGGIEKQGDEPKGPFQLAVAVTIEPEVTEEDADPEDNESEDNESDVDSAGDAEGRVVVVGDSDFISNNLSGATNLANQDLFLNMVNWAAEDEDLISIRPREAEDRRVMMNQQQQWNTLILSLLIIPGIILLTGVSVWWGRR